MKNSVVDICQTLWEKAGETVEPPQLVIIIVSNQTHCAFRSNVIGGNLELAKAMKEFAKKLEDGEGTLRSVPELSDQKCDRCQSSVIPGSSLCRKCIKK